MTELFEYIELIVYYDIRCKKYDYIYQLICNN
jgi:hypothetical protein